MPTIVPNTTNADDVMMSTASHTIVLVVALCMAVSRTSVQVVARSILTSDCYQSLKPMKFLGWLGKTL
jgi:hypothetical protein